MYLRNFANALSFLTGTRYEGKGLAEAVYAAVPALKGFDIFSGLYCIAMAIFAIVIVAALSGYRAIAPKLLVTMYITSIAFSFITMIWLSGIIGGAETTVIYGETYEIAGEMYRSYIDLSAMNNAVSTFVSMGVSLSLAIYNYRYYKERDELFLK